MATHKVTRGDKEYSYSRRWILVDEEVYQGLVKMKAETPMSYSKLIKRLMQ